MQLTHLTIGLLGLALIGSLIHFSLRALSVDRARQYAAGKQAAIADNNARINALNTDLASIALQGERDKKSFLDVVNRKDRLIESLQRQAAAHTLSDGDVQTFLDIVQTLSVAHKTWLPMTGTEPWRMRAKAQVEALNQIANRLIKSLETEASPSAEADAVRMTKEVA